jgi:hypothetical protein
MDFLRRLSLFLRDVTVINSPNEQQIRQGCPALMWEMTQVPLYEELRMKLMYSSLWFSFPSLLFKQASLILL